MVKINWLHDLEKSDCDYDMFTLRCTRSHEQTKSTQCTNSQPFIHCSKKLTTHTIECVQLLITLKKKKSDNKNVEQAGSMI